MSESTRLFRLALWLGFVFLSYMSTLMWDVNKNGKTWTWEQTERLKRLEDKVFFGVGGGGNEPAP